MRKVGEIGIGRIPVTRDMAQRTRDRANSKKNIPTACSNKSCKTISYLSVNLIRALGDHKYVCLPCHKKGKREVNQAILAIAERRKKIKQNQ